MATEKCTWGEWQEYAPEPGVTPYLDWSLTGSGESISREFNKDTNSDTLVLQPAVQALRMGRPPSNGVGNWVFAGLDKELPVPLFALDKTKPPRRIAKLPDKKIAARRRADGRPELLDNTVIAGVIDVGMPLGHDRWRLKNGKTRVLSAWQIVAPWDLKSDGNLPFGAEFYQDDINCLLAKYSGGSLDGHLDEHAFNEDTGLLNFYHGKAQRDVAGGTSHGAHVLDIVAGADRHAAEQEDFRDHVRIIAVNAPSSTTFGASGTYFDGYMFHAIKRIADIADKIWKEGRTAAERASFRERHGYDGFPIVINMSFGKQAGSKDTLDEFPSELLNFLEYRKESKLSPVDFIMPVGNDNLARCNAFLEPEAGKSVTLQWRHLPQDHTSNFAEIWSDPGRDADNMAVADVRLVSPCGAQSPILPPYDGQSRFCDVQDAKGALIGRMYLEYPTLIGQTEAEKVRYTLCVAATHAISPDKPTAPSGLWKIIAGNRTGKEELQYVAAIQTDQALTLGGALNLRSYFDDPAYERHDSDTGRLLDTYQYDPAMKKFMNTDIRAEHCPVRRHGTMNASAAHKLVARVGGYRASDGLHDPYSSSGRGPFSGKDDGTHGYSEAGKNRSGAPTASFPTDDGPSHFGILAAGAHAGSVRAMQGTSFASSQASRTVINAILDGSYLSSGRRTLFEAAKRVETHSAYANSWEPELIETLGSGRIPNPNSRAISRTGRE